MDKQWSCFLVATHFHCRKSLYGERSHLPWYLCFVFTASVSKYPRNLALKATDHTNTLFSPHSSLSYVSHTDWCWSVFNSPRNTLVFVCAAQGITHNPAVSQTNAYIKAEKLKQITVHFQYLQLLLWSTKINISATGSFLHPIAGSCTTLSHKSTDGRAREKQPGHIWFDLTSTD